MIFKILNWQFFHSWMISSSISQMRSSPDKLANHLNSRVCCTCPPPRSLCGLMLLPLFVQCSLSSSTFIVQRDLLCCSPMKIKLFFSFSISIPSVVICQHAEFQWTWMLDNRRCTLWVPLYCFLGVHRAPCSPFSDQFITLDESIYSHRKRCFRIFFRIEIRNMFSSNIYQFYICLFTKWKENNCQSVTYSLCILMNAFKSIKAIQME